MHHERKRAIFTQMVGDGGFIGIRIVRVGGIVLWLKHRFQSEALVPYVGQTVWINDPGDLWIFTGGFDSKNRPVLNGEYICSEAAGSHRHLRKLT